MLAAPVLDEAEVLQRANNVIRADAGGSTDVTHIKPCPRALLQKRQQHTLPVAAIAE